MCEKNENWVRSEKFSNVAKLFLLYFCAPKTKQHVSGPNSAQNLDNFRPEPDPKIPLHLTTSGVAKDGDTRGGISWCHSS